MTADLPMLAGVIIGFMVLVYLFVLGQIFALEYLYPIAFFFIAVGMAMFCSAVGVVAGTATAILLDPAFFEKYTKGGDSAEANHKER